MNYINYDKLKIQKCIKLLDLLINIFFINFSIFLLIFNMSKNLSAKYYQDNNERQQQKKKLVKDIKIFLKKKKKTIHNIVMNNTKI